MPRKQRIDGRVYPDPGVSKEDAQIAWLCVWLGVVVVVVVLGSWIGGGL